MTEYRALHLARRFAKAAMEVLQQFPGGSYYADEAREKLGEALGALLSGLRYFEAEDEVDDVNAPVSP